MSRDRTAGVEAAGNRLVEQGWEIKDRHWVYDTGSLRGVLDLVAQSPEDVLAIVVVNERGVSDGRPVEAVGATPRDLAHLRALTARWMTENEARFTRVRIDSAVAYLSSNGDVERLEYTEGVA